MAGGSLRRCRCELLVGENLRSQCLIHLPVAVQKDAKDNPVDSFGVLSTRKPISNCGKCHSCRLFWRIAVDSGRDATETDAPEVVLQEDFQGSAVATSKYRRLFTNWANCVDDITGR